MTIISQKTITSDAWSVLATGATQMTVQNGSTSPVKIYIGSSPPSLGTTDFFTLCGNGDTFPIVGISMTDTVYAIPAGDSSIQLVVSTQSNEFEYETVAASQTDQVLGVSGAKGDLLSSLLIIPATIAPGAVSVKDGSGTPITMFVGGAGSVSNLVPFTVALGLASVGGPWSVTTGANVSVVASGNFS